MRAEANAATPAARAAGDDPPPVPGPDVDSDPDVQRAAAAVAAARAAAEAAAPAVTRANVTDPESRIMKTATGWVQGYNAQAAVNANQIVVACTVTQDANDIHQYQPMVTATRAALAQAGVADPIGVVLADAGYCSDDNATAPGPDRLIATLKDHKQRRAACELGATNRPPPARGRQCTPGHGAPAAHPTRRRGLRPALPHPPTPSSPCSEPVFAVKANHGYDQFRRRGLAPAASECAMINTANNIGKMFAPLT